MFLYSPVSPDAMDWRTLFPAFYSEKAETNGSSSDNTISKVEFADIGCGYGGLLGMMMMMIAIIVFMMVLLLMSLTFDGGFLQGRARPSSSHNGNKHSMVQCKCLI